MIRIVAAFALLAAWPGAACFAEVRYLLETVTAADADRVMARYQLSLRGVAHREQNEFHCAVAAQAGLSAATFGQIRSESGVRGFELDERVRHVEHDASPGSAAPQASPAALGGLLTQSSPVPFYGSMVRASYVSQPAMTRIRAAEARAVATGGGVVAVIDTGVDPAHPALQGVLVPGYDFIANRPGIPSELSGLDQSTVTILDQSTVTILDGKTVPMLLNQSTVTILDQSTVTILDGTRLPAAFGHGTMVAGLVHLAAPTARIMPLRAFQADGSASLSDIVSAIYYAVDHGATVINMSFSQPAVSNELKRAIRYATDRNVICIASAGNNGREAVVYPAKFERVLGVGSTNWNDGRSPFSNYGSGCARTAAPGEAVITTYPGNNYAGVWGTSFSAALVSGAVAAMAQQNPAAVTFDRVKEALDAGAHISQGMGDARLDLYAAIVRYRSSR